MEVTNANFHDVLPQVQEAINKCTFIAIDSEFTGLNISRNINALDTPQEYYEKVRRNCKEFLIIQYGLCMFRYDKNEKTFKQQVFNFYIFRRPVNRNIPDQRFLCQASSIHFLVNENFDFNKLFREGIPYLNGEEITMYRNNVDEGFKKRCDLNESQQKENHESIPVPENAQPFIDDVIKQIEDFIKSDKDEVQLPKCSAFFRRLVYQTKSEKFEGKIGLETRQVDKERILFITRFKSKEDEKEKERKKYEEQLEELDGFIGFSKVIKMIMDSNKLVIGHNICLDLLHTIDKFLVPLPEDYAEFKEMTHSLFPNILDTKYMSSCEPFKDVVVSNVLGHLFDTLSDEPFTIPTVETEPGAKSYTIADKKEHEAGYDAYLTGTCFIAMWKYLGDQKKMDDTKTFSNLKLLEPYINRIFLMTLLDNQYINLAGKDLNPTRDHVFYLTFPKEWKHNDIVQLFSPFGNVHVAWLDDTSAYVSLYRRDQAAIAFSSLSNGESYRIMTYAKRKASLKGIPTPLPSPKPARRQRSSDVQPSKKRRIDSGGTNEQIQPKRSINSIEEEHLEECENSSPSKKIMFVEDDSWE